jgi:hypothetical protein
MLAGEKRSSLFSLIFKEGDVKSCFFLSYLALGAPV